MEFTANGKLMLFGEYLVLKGSRCLAIPLKLNQKITIAPNNSGNYHWQSCELDKVWFRSVLNKDLEIIQASDSEKALIIQKLLKFIFAENSTLFNTGIDFSVNSAFPLKWGLGSSSALVSLLSQWSGVDPYELLDNSFGGSGYDVACATATGPLIYQVKGREVRYINLSPAVTDNLLFVYTGNKQNTKQETRRFFDLEVPEGSTGKMNRLIERSIAACRIEEFEECMNESEELLSGILNKKRIREEMFPDYPGVIKSLGAWGGDFCMASFRDKREASGYFSSKGYKIQFSFSELIFQK